MRKGGFKEGDILVVESRPMSIQSLFGSPQPSRPFEVHVPAEGEPEPPFMMIDTECYSVEGFQAILKQYETGSRRERALWRALLDSISRGRMFSSASTQFIYRAIEQQRRQDNAAKGVSPCAVSA